VIGDEPDPRGIRIQTLIARAGIASRRAAEEIMRAGRVQLNGMPCTEPGTRAKPEDRIELDGKPLVAETRKLYLALNKPQGYICAMTDPHGRPTAASLFRPAIMERVYNVGRLDLESSGLILFTNDGQFASRAGHPSFGLVKEYEVKTDRRIHGTFAAQFEAGLEEGGETLKAERVVIKDDFTFTVWLAEGRNREIRRALSLFGLKALTLRRVSIGPVKLGDLPEGSWRHLDTAEIESLEMIFTASPGNSALRESEGVRR
jgi:23S rRNA pseudouridine2605 synthase